ncbi:MAG: DUF4974 domain-containing protein [Bacteroidia bacterium]|nr:DUF4974 domain-containing protein [Bacteroidia bacterium]
MNYFQKIIDFFTTHNISETGKEAFHQWLIDEKHTEEKDEALKKLWDNTSSKQLASTTFSLQQVKEKRQATVSSKKTTRLLQYWQTAAAILIFALLSSLYFYIFHNNRKTPDLIEQYVPIAEMHHVTLPDGSRVQLNSQSILLYPETFDGRSRSVYLMGEANFKVTPDTEKPFIVKSSDFQVTVLGTEFDVFAYPEDSVLRATVISGSVKVEYNNLETATVLSPGQQLAYNKHTKQDLINSPDMLDATAWQRGELVFRSTTLKEIITILERKYPYEFLYNLSGLKNDKYTFRFREKATLAEVMDIISQVAGNVQYRIENDICYIITH